LETLLLRLLCPPLLEGRFVALKDGPEAVMARENTAGTLHAQAAHLMRLHNLGHGQATGLPGLEVLKHAQGIRHVDVIGKRHIGQKLLDPGRKGIEHMVVSGLHGFPSF
jgi:hypothetical protein